MRHLLPRSALAACLLGGVATAQFTVVLPNGQAAAEGSTSNAFPWGRGTTGSLEIQTMYDSTHFTNQGITYPILIQGLRYRANGGATSAGGTYSQGIVDMATAVTNAATPSTTFAANMGANLTTVYNGPVTVLPTAAQTPGAWSVAIPLQSNFLYDPNQGDLCIFSHIPPPATAPITGSPSLQLDVQGDPLCTRIFNSSTTVYPNATGTITTNHAVVVEITYVPATGLYAGFSATPSTGPVGMTANFTDQSYTSDAGGVTSWSWDLDGDSVVDSTLQNPSFTYNTCGAYTVTLTVTDASHPASTLTRTGYIQVGITPITPNFTQTQVGPDTWQFTDTSSPTPSTWAWDFDGDNIVDSNLQNPIWVYPACTLAANVTLTTTNSCNAPYSITRQVTLVPPMVASFTFASIGPSVFQFTDTSVPAPSTWAWDLDGDGITDSTAQNPVWAYTSPCTSVAVRLTAADNCNNSGTTTRALVLSPNQLTPANIPNNGLSGSAGNLFDINVTNPNGVTICAFTLYPFTAATVATCNVYVCAEAGGFASNYQTAANWRLVATGTGSSTGTTTTPAPFALSNPVFLPQGQFAIAIDTNVGMRYTTITSSAVTAGPDFTITAGRSAGPLFSAGINNRGWAGTIHYSVAGGGNVAGYGYFGAGCPGSLGRSSLVASGTPAIGSTLNVTVNNLPANVAIMMTGFSKTNWLLGALPFDLGVYGAPNCNLRVSPDANLLLLGAGNSAVWPFNIPANVGIIGLNLYNQAVVLDPGFNAAGAVGSDAAGMMVGL